MRANERASQSELMKGKVNSALSGVSALAAALSAASHSERDTEWAMTVCGSSHRVGLAGFSA